MATHKERVEKVQEFFKQNKLFAILAAVLIVFMLFPSLFSQEKDSGAPASNTQSDISEEAEQQQPLDNTSKWQFYWIDFYILIGAGGFCSIMIIRQRRKAREELQ